MQQLGCHPVPASQSESHLRRTFSAAVDIRLNFRQSEVAEQRPFTLVDENVQSFDVSVDDSVRVKINKAKRYVLKLNHSSENMHEIDKEYAVLASADHMLDYPRYI